ncbi:cysteine--tRNA ligase [Puniceicoccales bacterium CK1056]|uniref:Cysteine--tRNA ligase n=1 Tax=Oceanipulchritudo coccoides TaxID=2706888 RepID=A0A6B2M2S2_9BACT|nr:cysteine--tRNA ligase [Oceanipulchritudo coccoides]NDV62105.1 cysteine--tRNA ligase [Oceanipulchritudo coccoides]
MEAIRLYDTMTRTVRELTAGASDKFRLYVCGPTVYGPAHIGNFLTFLRFDVLYRLLQLGGYNPLYVRNITDVDDKTIRRAMEQAIDLQIFTKKWTERFHEDCDLLNMLHPDVEPRATEHIAEQIQMVEKLIEKGNAYVGGDGSVYYRVAAFEDYGKLSHFDPEALQQQSTTSAGATNLSDEYERDSIADFALWKAHKEADGPVFWESPWGRGRPGWHLECSAMSLKYLGSGFDLHGGGEDLCFPHHENEIAQSEAATGKPFASHWMHSIHLLVEGKKMSKSLGNFFLLSDLLEKGFHPMEIRLALLGGHYRQQFNFTINGLGASKSGLSKLESGVRALLEAAGLETSDWEKFVQPVLPADWGLFRNAWKALCNDLNTPALLGALFNALKKARASAGDSTTEATESLQAAGALFFVLGVRLFARSEEAPADETAPTEIQSLAEERWKAKQSKDFARADALRSEIAEKGWLVVDQPGGYILKSNS